MPDWRDPNKSDYVLPSGRKGFSPKQGPFSFITRLAGFAPALLIGIIFALLGAYSWVEVAGLDLVKKDSYFSKEQVSRFYVERTTLKHYVTRTQLERDYISKDWLKSRYVDKEQFASLATRFAEQQILLDQQKQHNDTLERENKKQAAELEFLKKEVRKCEEEFMKLKKQRDYKKKQEDAKGLELKD